MNEIIETIPVTSMVNCTICLILPEYHYERTWPRKGVTIQVRKDALVNSFYQPGVEFMFKQGMLYVEDKDTRVLLGLEGDEVEKELIKLDDKLLSRIVKLMPISEVKTTLDQLTPTQKQEVARYAVANYGDLKMDRIELFKEALNIDIPKAVEMKKGFEGV